MDRAKALQQISDPGQVWDMVVIGGGSTGAGVALDAASRGYKTLLIERVDFAKGTSSRSTKLAHGGVRYLEQGNIPLVREALRERGLMIKNAPHLVKNEAFVIPSYRWWASPYYTIGLKIYDMLSGSLSIGKSKYISRKETIKRLPTIKTKGLNSGVLYHDGQFDDARLALNIVQTMVEQGGTAINYMKAVSLKKSDGKVSAVVAKDTETGNTHTIKARSVINATGVFVDDVLSMDKKEHVDIVQPSQGVHLVFDKSFLPGGNAIMIPKTEDGRVLFAVPWHDKVLVGTTDTELDGPSLEPKAMEEEIEFILRTANNYMEQPVSRDDVKSVYAGLRPLVSPGEGDVDTKDISRDHKIMVGDSGLITVTGGKWTTYREMAEETVDKVIEKGMLEQRDCVTEALPIHGSGKQYSWDDPLFYYGSDKEAILALAQENEAWNQPLHPDYDYIGAQVIWAVRHEMARTLEDMLARRTRMLFMDARAAIDMAPVVADLMAEELNRDEAWKENQCTAFRKVANNYLLKPYNPEK